MRISLRTALILGIAIRIVLSGYTQHPAVYAKAESLDQLFLFGSDPLARTTSFGPSFYLFYAPFYLIYWLLSQQVGISYDFVLDTLLKIPPLIGDIVTTYALYEISLSITKRADRARYLALSYFLNPYVIWITAVVGHAESLWVGFVLLSIVYLTKDRVGMAGLALAVATMFRELPLLTLPFFLYYTYRRRQSLIFAKPYFVLVGILAIPYAISFLIVYNASPALAIAYLQHFVGSGSAVQGTGQYGIDSIKTFTYNFTGILASMGFWPVVSQLLGFTHFLVVFAVLGIAITARGNGSIVWLNRAILICYSLLLLFTPLIQDEYLSWILPFAMLAVVSGLPRIAPHALTWSALLIEPITQGNFFYYTLATFGFSRAAQLSGSWPLNIPTIYDAVTAAHALSIVFVLAFSTLAILGRRRIGE